MTLVAGNRATDAYISFIDIKLQSFGGGARAVQAKFSRELLPDVPCLENRPVQVVHQLKALRDGTVSSFEKVIMLG